MSTSNQKVTLSAVQRLDSGSAVNRRLRKQGSIPAIIYGGTTAPQSIQISSKELIQAIKHGLSPSEPIQIDIETLGTEQVLVKKIQRHPVKSTPIHVDFLRLSEDKQVRVQIPVRLVNEDTSPGIKQGGKLYFRMERIETLCYPADLVNFIEIDLSAVQAGDSVYLRDIVPPKGMIFPIMNQPSGRNLVLLTIEAKRKDVTEAAASEESATPAESAV